LHSSWSLCCTLESMDVSPGSIRAEILERIRLLNRTRPDYRRLTKRSLGIEDDRFSAAELARLRRPHRCTPVVCHGCGGMRGTLLVRAMTPAELASRDRFGDPVWFGD